MLEFIIIITGTEKNIKIIWQAWKMPHSASEGIRIVFNMFGKGLEKFPNFKRGTILTIPKENNG